MQPKPQVLIIPESEEEKKKRLKKEKRARKKEGGEGPKRLPGAENMSVSKSSIGGDGGTHEKDLQQGEDHDYDKQRCGPEPDIAPFVPHPALQLRPQTPH